MADFNKQAAERNVDLTVIPAASYRELLHEVQVLKREVASRIAIRPSNSLRSLAILLSDESSEKDITAAWKQTRVIIPDLCYAMDPRFGLNHLPVPPAESIDLDALSTTLSSWSSALQSDEGQSRWGSLLGVDPEGKVSEELRLSNIIVTCLETVQQATLTTALETACNNPAFISLFCHHLSSWLEVLGKQAPSSSSRATTAATAPFRETATRISRVPLQVDLAPAGALNPNATVNSSNRSDWALDLQAHYAWDRLPTYLIGMISFGRSDIDVCWSAYEVSIEDQTIVLYTSNLLAVLPNLEGMLRVSDTSSKDKSL